MSWVRIPFKPQYFSGKTAKITFICKKINATKRGLQLVVENCNSLSTAVIIYQPTNAVSQGEANLSLLKIEVVLNQGRPLPHYL